MDRRCSDQGWRAASLAAALFAITLNFVQPVVHATLMRDGGPVATGLWASICLPDASLDQKGSAPAGQLHECCLGLAHAPSQTEPSTLFVSVDRTAAIVQPLDTAQLLAPVGIRDGPSQPRAPPLPT